MGGVTGKLFDTAAYLAAEGRRELAEVKDYLTAIRDSDRSLYEVVEVQRGLAVIVEDLLRDRESHRVLAPEESKRLTAGDRISARIIRLKRHFYFTPTVMDFEREPADALIEFIDNIVAEVLKGERKLAKKERREPLNQTGLRAEFWPELCAHITNAWLFGQITDFALQRFVLTAPREDFAEALAAAHALSLLRGLDPAAHLAMGEVLRELKHENILVVGSGFSFHNLGAFSWQGVDSPDPANDAFQNWLIEVCAGPIPQSESKQRLIDWEQAPSARYCHPREEHLLPLHVCLGMTDKPASVIFDDYILGKRAVAFLW